MSATTSASRIVAPFVAVMSASGEATYAYVQQEIVTIAGIDYEFDATLSTTDTTNLLNSFVATGFGAGTNSTLSVSLDNTTAFKAVLQKYINGSTPATLGGLSVEGKLASDLNAGLLAAISSDGLINTVQDTAFTDVHAYVNSDLGVQNMIVGLQDDDRCTLLYTQISKSGLDLYKDGTNENPTTTALPLKGGDKLTFVFNIDMDNVTPYKSQKDITNANGADGANVTSDVANPVGYTSNLSFNLASKRVAFNLIMAGETGAAITGLTPYAP